MFLTVVKCGRILVRNIESESLEVGGIQGQGYEQRFKTTLHKGYGQVRILGCSKQSPKHDWYSTVQH